MADDTRVPELPPIDNAGAERAMLRQFLDYYRAVLERKADGLTEFQLATSIAPSDLTIGGLVLHMASVEEGWFSRYFADRPLNEPWIDVAAESVPVWALENADRFSADELRGHFRTACRRSRRIEAEAESLDVLSTMPLPGEQRWNLRWIMIHMIEEYARHCGHADFIRQAIDGTVGD